MKASGVREMEGVAKAKVVYHEQLYDITIIDERDYDHYINGRSIPIVFWRRGEDDDGYYEMALELIRPAMYIREKWVGIRSAWQETTIYKLQIMPPRYLHESDGVPVEQIGLRVACVYWEQMGKVELDELHRLPTRGRKVAMWYDMHGLGGRFKNTLRKTRTSAIILEREWLPRVGYCWSEKQLYLITIPEQLEDV
jgi:hypothetical protein